MYKVLKLPCGHADLEIRDKREDQYITCPVCFKKFVLYWKPMEKMKIYGIDQTQTNKKT